MRISNLHAPATRRAVALLALAALAWSATAAADIAHIPATRDATLIEDALGARANGAGTLLFAGRTNEEQDALRRGLLYFDVAAALPRAAIIRRVTLVLHAGAGNPATPARVAVHRVLQPWSEGPTASSGGSGAPAQPGDVTWVHRRYDTGYWRFAGGHFVPVESAALTVTGPGFYAWTDCARLQADVRLWLKAPKRNHGWILVGDEATPQSSKRMDSREATAAEFRPVLTVEYRLPGRR